MLKCTASDRNVAKVSIRSDIECVSLSLNIYRVSGLNALGFPVPIVRTLIFPFLFVLFLFFLFSFLYFHGTSTYALSTFPFFSTSLFSTRNLIALHPLGHFRTISCVSGEPDGKPQMQNPIECFNDKHKYR